MASRAFYGIEKADKTVDYIYITNGAHKEFMEELNGDYGTYEKAAELISRGDSLSLAYEYYDETPETVDSVQEFLNISKFYIGIEMAFIFTNNKWERHETYNF